MRVIAGIIVILFPVIAFGAEGRVLIPAGTALIGTDMESLSSQLGDARAKPDWYKDETPSKKIAVEAFLIDVTEVTNERYKSIAKDHSFPQNLTKYAAVNVQWDDADRFCKAVGGRLPTEVEWEYAARGPKGLIFPWGNDFYPRNVIYMDSAGEKPGLTVGSYDQESSGANLLGGGAPVATLEEGKSPFGLYDMAGGVWEWVDTWYDEARGLRTLKGGSWLTPLASVRSATRLADYPSRIFNDYGFRCAYNAE